MMILLKVTRARSVLTTTFWMTGYAAYVSLGVAQAQGMPVGARMKLYCPPSPGRQRRWGYSG